MGNTTGRFAPSPSGRMHLGNIFSALLAWLSARAAGGSMVLRIEDLDRERCKREYSLQLQRDLAWLGLDWERGGCIPEYMQSCRDEVYIKYFDVLCEKGLVYPCYCSRASLHAASAPHASDGRVIYSGACKGMTEKERSLQTKAPAWRLSVPDRVYSFTDGNYGDLSQNLASECGDFIIRRADGVFSYQLAVVIDDALMGVDQIVRGSDLLDSTPRQIYLQELLGFHRPEYHHLPLLLSQDGRRLSKRDKDMDIGELSKNFSASDIIGRLACLAGIIDRPEAASPKELIKEFSWDKVKKENIYLPEGLFA